MKNMAGVLWGPYDQLIDHIYPLCDLLSLPLIYTDKAIEGLLDEFYPYIPKRYLNYKEAPIKLLSDYEGFFCCRYKFLLNELFFFAEVLTNKKLRSVWCPHGNSDKGYNGDLAEAMELETHMIVYGHRMLNYIQKYHKDKNIHFYHVGNYRHHYYLKNRKIFSDIVNEQIFSKCTKPQSILYAPTWSHGTVFSEYFREIDTLISKCSDKYNVIIKVHPKTFRQNRFELEIFAEKYPNATFLTKFPLIYPLLANIDLYIGDCSSIGYDFLTFNRPMLFYNRSNKDTNDPETYLYRAGDVITKEQWDEIDKHIDEALQTNQRDKFYVRKNLYDETFKLSPEESAHLSDYVDFLQWDMPADHTQSCLL